MKIIGLIFEREPRRRPGQTRHISRSAMAPICAIGCLSLLALVFSAPAAALGSPGHRFLDGHEASGAAPSLVRPHAVAPLTEANFVVTDLSTNTASAYDWSTVTPNNTGGASCNTGPSQELCLTYGSGLGPNGGNLVISPGPGGWTAGAAFDSIGGMSAVGAAGQACFTGESADNVAVSSAVAVDQVDFTGNPTPLQHLAIQVDCTTASTDISGTIAYNIVPTDPEQGYYLFGQQGEITGFGNDNYLSYLNGAQYYNLNAPIVAMAPTPTGGGYWMVGTDGGVFSSGDAGFYGSTGNIHLNKPVVGMAATPDGGGYWFVASDGGIFAYGDAGFYGSRGGQPLNKPIVGMAVTPDGKGYWLVASDGGIFSYGDAGFYGSTGAIHLNQPVVGMTPTPSGHGYWFVASDGGIFAYGDAGFYGSTGAIHLNSPIVGMTAAPDGAGYWFTASDGGVFNYGSAGFAGSLGGSGVNDVAGMSLGI